MKTLNSTTKFKTRFAALVTLLFTVFLMVHPAISDDIFEDQKYIAGDNTTSSVYFGWAIAINDGIIGVGAPEDHNAAYEAGSAYLFNATSGEKLFRLNPIGAQELDHFGTSIAIGSGLVSVGSRSTNYDPSSVHVFSVATGNQLHQIVPVGSSTGCKFGASVAMENNLLAVGDPQFDGGATYTGSAYLYDASTGIQLNQFLADDAESMDKLGSSIDMQNGLVVAGSPGDDDNGNSSGSAYIFDATSGEQLFKLMANDGEWADHLGHSVAIDNGIVAVGAPLEGAEMGAVYIFDATTGAQISKIVPDPRIASDEFGTSISMDNGMLAVGAPGHDFYGPASGIVYIFDLSTGTQVHQFYASDADAATNLGISVALQGNKLASGAPMDRTDGRFVGAAYSFSFSPPSAVPMVVSGFTLHPNHPNPFNPGTTIGYSVEKGGHVELAIYSLDGNLVRVLVNQWQDSGVQHSSFWDGKDSHGRTLASGVYYARLQSRDMVGFQKMVLLK